MNTFRPGALALALAIAIVTCAAMADETPKPGPLVVKAYLPVVYPNSDNMSNVQRVYLRLQNDTSDPMELEKVEGVFLNAQDEKLFTDSPPVTPLGAGEKREIYLVFQNPGQFPNLSARVTIRYTLKGAPYEQAFTLTPDQRSRPSGFYPGDP